MLKIEKKVNFIKTIPLFNNLTRTYLMQFSYNFKVLNCNKDQLIYQQGSPANFVYIVQDGLFEVTRKTLNPENFKREVDMDLKAIFNDS